MDNPRSDYIDGPALTFSLLDSLRHFQPRCIFVHISSAAVYGNPKHLPVDEQDEVRPISSYGFHKWQSEIICREFASLWNMKTTSARLFSAYGPGLRRQVLWDITYKILTQPELRLQGDGKESRDFVHIQDIARGLQVIIQKANMQGEVYNVASGEETTIADLAAVLLGSSRVERKVLFSGESPAGVPKNWKADIGLIKSFGFVPQISLKDGVRAFAEWARSEIQGA
jgi:UDP-glucose 4-epimerase